MLIDNTKCCIEIEAENNKIIKTAGTDFILSRFKSYMSIFHRLG